LLGPKAFLQCLRSVSVKEIISVSAETLNNLISWGPVVDGVVLTGGPDVMMKAGNLSNHVPVMAGGNRNEGSAFIQQIAGRDFNSIEYAGLAFLFWGEKSEKVLEEYEASAYPSPYWALSAAVGDFLLKCPNRMVVNYLSDVSVPTYLYEFTHNSTQFLWTFPGNPDLACYHGAEIVFVFGDHYYPFTEKEWELAQMMMTYWTNFARNGDPGTVNGVTWNQYSPPKDTNIVFDLDVSFEF